MLALAGQLRSAMTAARQNLQEWPDEPAAFMFEFLAKTGLLFLSIPLIGTTLRKAGQALSIGLEIMAPAMPLNIRESRSFSADPRGFYFHIFWRTAPLTVLFCYVLNGIFTLQCGTFLGTDPDRLYFLYDFYNASLYLVVCPVYVSTAVCLIIITALSWREINARYSEHQNDGHSDSLGYFSPSTRLAGFVAISFLITGFYISNYIDDLANPEKISKLYWFFNKDASGVRVLNKDGYYYTLMNAFLLFITSMSAFCYIAISIEMFKLGKHVGGSTAISDQSRSAAESLSIEAQEKRLIATMEDFAYSYVVAKLLILAYALNILIWQISPAGKVANMHSAIAALLIIGLFFLVFPELYLNRRWYWKKLHYLKSAMVSDKQGDIDIEYQNLRPKKYRRFAMVLDLISSALLFLILKSQYDVTDVLDVIGNYWTAFWFNR